MGVIKLPKNSIDFFKSNQNKIFETGELSEGPWNNQLSEKIWENRREKMEKNMLTQSLKK